MEKQTLISTEKIQQKLKTQKYKKENGKKTKRVEIRLTEMEYRELVDETKEENISVSQLLRNRARCKPVLDPSIAVNIVQLNDLFNQADESDAMYELKKEYNALLTKIYASYIAGHENSKTKKQKENIKNMLEVV